MKGRANEMVLGKAESETASGDRPVLVIAANAFWNIANFRLGLIAALNDQGYKIVVVAPDADPTWGSKRGAETISVPIDRSGLNPFRDALLVKEFLKLFRFYRPAAFMGFTAKPNIYGSFAASLCRVPALPNVSGLGTAFINPGPLSALVGALYRIAFRNCAIVFFQNPDDCQLFIDRKIVRRDQARLLPGSGIDLDHFSPAPAPPSAPVRFLFIGRLLGDKGVREFVEAAKLLRGEHSAWQFQILGPIDEGNRSAIKESELQNWVADGNVQYLEQTADVRPHIAAATAVVLPSYREGLSRSLLEAAAMARPLIATDVPGNRQIVRDNFNGLLCAVRDPIDLARAMERMGTMTSIDREALGLAGRELVEREFDEATVIQTYSDALTQLCSRGGS
jgi:glycosyltransferase involved in cell wall biosynthesis